MKKKIISIFLSCFLVFSSAFSSFANPAVLAPMVISKDLLMAIMGAGVVFGLSLPKTDSEYWEYTRALKKHLQVVDDQYLEHLEKSYKEWKSNNNNKPDNEKKPLEIPLVGGLLAQLKDLFNNVGNEVSQSNVLLGGTVLDGLPLFQIGKYSNYENFIEGGYINTYELKDGDTLIFSFKVGEDVYKMEIKAKTHSTYDYLLDINRYIYKNSEKMSFTTDLLHQVNLKTSKFEFGIGWSSSYVSNGQYGLSYFYKESNIGNGKVYYRSNLLSSPSIYKSPSEFISKPHIEYNPKDPAIENNSIKAEVQDITIPNIESMPGYDSALGTQSPFDVQDSPDIDPSPSPNPNPGTGTGGSTGGSTGGGSTLPSLPSWGSGLDFSPITQGVFVDKFPFCLAKDVGDIISVFDVEPKPPVFKIPLVSEELTIDLTEFELWFDIMRFFILIGFIISLIVLTRGIIG